MEGAVARVRKKPPIHWFRDPAGHACWTTNGVRADPHEAILEAKVVELLELPDAGPEPEWADKPKQEPESKSARIKRAKAYLRRLGLCPADLIDGFKL